MRLSPDSSAASEKLVYDRSGEFGVSDARVKAMSSVPQKSASTAAPAALTVLCPDVSAGNGGVGISGAQVGSAAVSGLPSSARIAVTGRQKSNSYLASQETIAASARARFSRANRRALSVRLIP